MVTKLNGIEVVRMDGLEKILETENGAKFRRADIHIHSFGEDTGSYDVSDSSMTPEAIVELALEEGLEVISITDHNEIGNSIIAKELAKDKPLLVLLGIEVSTTNGHLLVYFSKVNNLKKFHSSLTISPDKKQCHESLATCLSLAEQTNGICIAAHVDSEKGFIQEIGKYNEIVESIITHKNLLGIEIKSKESSNWFTIHDVNSERKILLKKRNQVLQREDYLPIAKLMNSDAHKLSSLGRNISGAKKITRLKMDELSFESFVIALRDPESRVRIEELIPGSVPYFLGVTTEGGFLGKKHVQLSKNLNCIIGGRGAGKSTLIESIQCASGNLNKEKSKLYESDAWPDRIILYLKDESGEVHQFIKDKYQEAVLYNGNSEEDSKKLKIESYNQGKTAEIIQHAKKDPSVLLRFFDEFIDFEDLFFREEETRGKISDQQNKVIHLREEVNKIPDVKSALSDVERQFKILKKNKLEELIEWESSLQEGRKFREDIVENLKLALNKIKDGLQDKTLLNQITELEISQLKIGKKQYTSIIDSVTKLSELLDTTSEAIVEEWEKVKTGITSEIAEWQKKESEILSKIEAKKDELEKAGITFDIAYIRQLAQRKAKYNKELSILKTRAQEYKEALKELEKLYKQRLSIKKEIYKRRYAWVIKVNNYLQLTVHDFSIKITVNESCHSPELIEHIASTANFYHSKKPKLDSLIKQIGISELKRIVDNKRIVEIENLTKDGSKLFTKDESKKIAESLFNNDFSNRLMTIKYDDFPEMTISKKEEVDGETKHIVKNFTDLSLGQQQSIMLTILLYSDNKNPLIIDQPEDNLDSEFIYKTIVSNLKRVKEMRQVIIVTHNANIAVLGDSELIIPLKSTSEKAQILDRGSIDNKKTIDRTCSILEGSKIAFKRRQLIYNI